jgi:hypothetical protein
MSLKIILLQALLESATKNQIFTGAFEYIFPARKLPPKLKR